MLDRSSPKKYLSLHHHAHLLGLDGLGYFQSYNVFKDTPVVTEVTSSYRTQARYFRVKDLLSSKVNFKCLMIWLREEEARKDTK